MIRRAHLLLQILAKPEIWHMGKSWALVLPIVPFVVLGLLAARPSLAQAEEAPEPDSSAEVEAAADEVDEAVRKLEENKAEVAAKKAEIAMLDAEIAELKTRHSTTQAEAALIDNQLKRLQQRLAAAQLELKQTELTIAVVSREQGKTAKSIEALEAALGKKRAQLKAIIRALYAQEQQSFIRIFFDTGSLSEALSAREAYEAMQNQHIALVGELKAEEEALRLRRAELEQQEADLSQLSRLLAGQQRDLAAQRREQQQFLQAKRAQQLQYEAKIAEAKAARDEIARNVFTLKDAGVQLTFTQATDMARYAAKLTGVRAALLLGVLKVETNLGTNLGSGRYPDDMHPSSREAFLRVTAKLGLDPTTAPISARPRSYQGWGGAMGPGQFMPATWEVIEGRVAALMGQPTVNPYELTDAFVATALFLADRGATERAREYEAVNRYLAGPNWQRFTWYGDRVLAIAAEYEKEGL